MRNEEIIYHYFKQELSGPEWEAFVRQFHNDPDFKSKVLDYKVLQDGLDGLHFDEIRTKVQSWKEELLETEGKNIDDETLNEEPEPGGEQNLNLLFDKTDLSFTEKMEGYKIIQEGFSGIRFGIMREKVGEWAKEMKKTPVRTESNNIFSIFKNRRAVIGMAASVLLILSAATLWWFGDFNGDQQHELMTFLETAYITPASFGDRSEQEESRFSAAQQSYETGNLQATLTLLNGMNSADSLYANSLYLKGHVAYKLEEYQMAQSALRELDQLLSPQEAQAKKINLENALWTLFLSEYQQYAQDGVSEEETILLKEELTTLQGRLNEQDVYYQNAKEFQILLK